MGDLVYMATKNINLPKGCVHRLFPNYIEPYNITSYNASTPSFALEKPGNLRARNFQPIPVPKPHIPNNGEQLKVKGAHVHYDFGQDAGGELDTGTIDLLASLPGQMEPRRHSLAPGPE